MAKHRSAKSTITESKLEASRALLATIARAAADMGARELVALDMTNHTALFDYFLIATGTSQRQLTSIADEIDRVVKHDLHERRLNAGEHDQSHWVVLDYGTVVAHLFDDNTRAFYGLEALWADAPRVDLASVIGRADVG